MTSYSGWCTTGCARWSQVFSCAPIVRGHWVHYCDDSCIYLIHMASYDGIASVRREISLHDVSWGQPVARFLPTSRRGALHRPRASASLVYFLKVRHARFGGRSSGRIYIYPHFCMTPCLGIAMPIRVPENSSCPRELQPIVTMRCHMLSRRDVLTLASGGDCVDFRVGFDCRWAGPVWLQCRLS